jgi:hypothetical protein
VLFIVVDSRIVIGTLKLRLSHETPTTAIYITNECRAIYRFWKRDTKARERVAKLQWHSPSIGV